MRGSSGAGFLKPTPVADSHDAMMRGHAASAHAILAAPLQRFAIASDLAGSADECASPPSPIRETARVHRCEGRGCSCDHRIDIAHTLG